MLEMVVDDLNMDGTFSSEVYKVHIFDLGNIDMNERFVDVTGMDERVVDRTGEATRAILYEAHADVKA